MKFRHAKGTGCPKCKQTRVLTAADAFVSKDGQKIILGKKEVDALVEAVIERRKVKAKKR